MEAHNQGLRGNYFAMSSLGFGSIYIFWMQLSGCPGPPPMTWNRNRRLRNPIMTELSRRRLGHWSPLFQQLVPRPNCCWKRLNIQVRWGICPIERLVISSLVLSGSQVKRILQKPILVNLSNTLANVHQLWRGIATADSEFRRKLAKSCEVSRTLSFSFAHLFDYRLFTNTHDQVNKVKT